MRKYILTAAAALALTFPVASFGAEEVIHIPKEKWSFNGVTGHWDKEQLQRGFQVYKEVCAACHSLEYVSFRNFEALGYSEAQVKALALEYEVEDGPDDNGDMFKRKAKPSDKLPKPYPNDKFARASNNGALPPDLSLMAKARHGGPDYIYHLLIGYEEAPKDLKLADGMSYNKYFTGHQIAMPKQIEDGKVDYADGTKNDAQQIAKDVSAFLMWTAEPKMEARHATGVRVILFTLLFTVLAYFLKRRIWARIGH
jgi:ubiquinol-cytochrome c reductase cytochrome c1 subunit